MATIHVIIADPSQLVRLGIISILHQMDYPLSIREVGDPDKLNQTLYKNAHHLLIISHSMLHSCLPDTIQSLQVTPRQAIHVVINDMPGYHHFQNIADEYIEPFDGENSIYRKLDKLLRQLAKSGSSEKLTGEISNREKEVLKLIALGLTNKEIAEKLFISSHTVITHRKNITNKLGIKTIAGLTVYAVIHKLITLDDLKQV